MALAAAGLLTAACVPSGEPVTTADHPTESADLTAIDGDSLVDDAGNDYRLAGINAPDRGECLAEEAATRLRELTAGEVQIAFDVERLDQFDRRLVYLSSGGELVNEILVGEGLALAIHAGPNQRHQDQLFTAMDRAMSQTRGVWSLEACGQGPLARVEISEVRANPPGPDEKALESEYVVLVNEGTVVVDLSGWTLRDESTRNRFVFPEGLGLDPGAGVTVTSGGGPLGFGLDAPIWNNSGDTAYLLDDQGRVVSHLAVSE